MAFVIVVGSDVFAGKAFNDEDHDVGVVVLGSWDVVGGVVDGGEEAVEFVRIEIVGVMEGGFAESANYAERGVEHDCGFGRAIYILVGIAECDGANGGGGASAHADDAEGYGGDEEGYVGEDRTCFATCF